MHGIRAERARPVHLVALGKQLDGESLFRAVDVDQGIESVRKFLAAAVCLAGISLGPVAARQPGTSAKPPIDYSILHAQVILDHLGFSPGILDGRDGQSLVAALKGFQTARELPVTGKLDAPTLAALAPYRELRPVKQLRLTADTLSDPYVNPMPKDPDKQAMLPPGPNGPVGVVWLDLSKEHYGIHGTPEPQTIGRTESHGCIRLTNWDAARLALMVRPGTPAIFQE